MRCNTTMTFLFTDIAGSTRLWEESAEMHQRVERHFEVLREAVEDVGGEVFATMGDGIAAAFSSAEAAVRTAIVAQCQLRAMGLSVRMGVHSGEAEHVDGDFRGRPLNRAARIMAAGHGGQILVSDLTAELVRSGPHPMEMSDLGTHRLRDLIHPERLWQVEHPHLDRDFPPVRGLDTYSNNLPTQRSSLIGRERDTARVTDLMGHHRLVTLTGVGGVGKTRLAVQAAADMLSRFASVWFVELASVADPDDVADAIAVSLEVSAVTDPLGAAAAMLSGADALLVIDNCEHVVDSVAEAIDALTLKCPGLSVIATSREPLGVDGEHVMTVRPLHPSSTAIDLFNQRSLSAGGDPTAMDVATIEQICRRLDGIPLAIELAASRAATLGPTAILAGLDNRLSLLGRRRRRTVDRHATMRETIDWSYRLLDAGEQRLFRSLAMFSNGFELDAAISIAGSSGVDEYTATTRIDSLVQKSMIVPEVQPRAVRYRMLQTMRAFALERVDEHGERLEATTAMAEWVATITDLPFADCCSAMVERNAIRLEREAENWRDAVMLAARLPSGALAARLCGPPVAFFLLGRHDLGDFVRPLLDVCGDKPQQRRAVLCALIVSAAGATDPAQLQVWADEIAGIDAIEPTGLGGLMQWLALAWRGDFAASVELCAAASLDPRISQSTRDMFVGIATLDHFSLTNATEDRYGLIERALEVATRSDVALHRVSCLLGAAWGLSTHRPDQSLVLVRRALADIPNVPALTRLTLPGSASRLLAQLDPGIAARGLLEQLDSTAQRRSFVDLIPLFYATALLHRVGHPSAGPAMETMSVSPIAPYLSMMDFVDLARRASTANNAVSLTELETIVRIALGDLCGTADAKFHQGTTSVSSSSSAER